MAIRSTAGPGSAAGTVDWTWHHRGPVHPRSWRQRLSANPNGHAPVEKRYAAPGQGGTDIRTDGLLSIQQYTSASGTVEAGTKGGTRRDRTNRGAGRKTDCVRFGQLRHRLASDRFSLQHQVLHRVSARRREHPALQRSANQLSRQSTVLVQARGYCSLRL